jgi:hypothetical protein
MNAVVASLNERAHLFKLPDGLCSDLGAWRCFVGRGGRARLERIDHVTHETVTNVKAEQLKVQNHYAVRHQGLCSCSRAFLCCAIGAC